MASAQAPLRVDGTAIELTTRDGRVLRSADLVVATLTVGYPGSDIAVTIEQAEVDRHATGGRVVLHHFVIKDASGRSADLCAPGADGRSLGFPVPDGAGRLRADLHQRRRRQMHPLGLSAVGGAA